MTWLHQGDMLHRVFMVGIVLKGIDGMLELAGGLVLLLSPTFANGLLRSLTGLDAEFGVIYLLAHGVAKVVLVAALLRGRLWAYPALMVFLLAFIGYQLYEIQARPTVGLAALTAFDAVIASLTFREYRGRRGPHLSVAG